MITVRGADVRVGARLLLSGVSFHVAPGDRIGLVGLVGRNGAGKTTLLDTLAGLRAPAAGTVTRTGSVGHLAQDARAADPAMTVTDRILAARGLDRAVRRLAEAARRLGGSSDARALAPYDAAETAFEAGGGYAAEAARVSAGLGLPHTLSCRNPPPAAGRRWAPCRSPRRTGNGRCSTAWTWPWTGAADWSSSGSPGPGLARRGPGGRGLYPGAIVMVTHDEGALDALRPERVLLLPDADDDLWSAEYRELATLA